MKKDHLLRCILVILSLINLSSCTSTLLNLPAKSENSTLGEITPYTRELMDLPKPNEKIVIGVYKFKDQTGQYKMVENSSSFSTAIPQGTTSILLKALEDSKWFRPIERENIGNLLNERQIIRSTRKEYKVAADGKTPIDDQIPPLLYAGIILEGGIISYDSNVITGGIGARYFGLGANTQYRQDRISVYLRVVSTMTGEILKTVYTSKTILSTSINGSFFRYIDTERLLEAEMGITQNEPVSMAVTQAIEKAVYSLIVEGVRDGLFMVDNNSIPKFRKIVTEYNNESETNNYREIGNRHPTINRGNYSIYGILSGDNTKSDYVNPATNLGIKIGFKYFLNDYLNADISGNYMKFENKNIISKNFFSTELNLELLAFPYYKFTPFIFGGIGSMFTRDKNYYKYQFGGGLEYMPQSNFSLRLFSQYDMGFKDDWDNFNNGKRKDQVLKIGLGVNYYFPKKNKNH